MSEGAKRLPHFPALDGLRGLALLGVLFYHSDGLLTGGYLGVDLFFVLSGFLITSLLLREHEGGGRIDLAAFWVRRARRLFPALLALMPAIALYARFVAKPGELASIRGDALATLAYVANWHTILADKSYWELFVSPSPLEHTWSLAIEEQFYVLWPLVVWLLLRRFTSRAVGGVALGLTALSMFAMVTLYDRSGASRAYLGTDARASGILLGSALATVISTRASFTPRVVRLLDGVGILAVVGLGVAWWRIDGQDSFLYRGGFWLTEIAALVLIACAVGGPGSVVARALSLRPLTAVGMVSYGAYLYHWPINLVLSAERVPWGGVGLHVTRFAATFALAALSYRFLEQPIRRRGLPKGRAKVLVPSAVALAALCVVGGTLARAEPPKPPPPPEEEPLPPDAGVPEYRIMVVGDSTANSLGWVIRGFHDPRVSVVMKGNDGCSMLRDSCDGEKWAEQMTESKADATLVVVGGAFLYGHRLDGAWREPCHPAWHALFEETMSRRIGDLAGAVDGTVWAVTAPYPLGRYDNASFREKTDCINASIAMVVSDLEGVRTLDLAQLICPEGKCPDDAKRQRPDGVHYDIDGSHDLAIQLIERIVPPDPLAPAGASAAPLPSGILPHESAR